MNLAFLLSIIKIPRGNAFKKMKTPILGEYHDIYKIIYLYYIMIFIVILLRLKT